MLNGFNASAATENLDASALPPRHNSSGGSMGTKCFNCSQNEYKIQNLETQLRDVSEELQNTAQELEMIEEFKVQPLQQQIDELKQNNGAGEGDMMRYRLQGFLQEIEGQNILDQIDESDEPKVSTRFVRDKIGRILE